MKTYSDGIRMIRAYLKAHKAEQYYSAEDSDQAMIEGWRIQDKTILISFSPSGTWSAWKEISSFDDDDQAKLMALDRLILGNRPDLDLISGMSRICAVFLEKLLEFPTCSDLDCGQKICAENRILRHNVQAFQAKLKPDSKEKTNVPA